MRPIRKSRRFSWARRRSRGNSVAPTKHPAPVPLPARSVVVLLRRGTLATAIAAVGLPAASANRPERRAAGPWRTHAAALGVGPLAVARIKLAPQAAIAAQPGAPGTGAAYADRSRGVGLPDQRRQNQHKDDGKKPRQHVSSWALRPLFESLAPSRAKTLRNRARPKPNPLRITAASHKVKSVSARIAGPGRNPGPNSGASFRRAQPTRTALTAPQRGRSVTPIARTAPAVILVPMIVVPVILAEEIEQAAAPAPAAPVAAVVARRLLRPG
jgi:hypothetical protein